VWKLAPVRAYLQAATGGCTKETSLALPDTVHVLPCLQPEPKLREAPRLRVLHKPHRLHSHTTHARHPLAPAKCPAAELNEG
jgi:hypothetical protein